MKIEKLKGVGPKTAKHLNSLGIFTIKDAIEYYPRDYEDRSSFKSLNFVSDGETVSVVGEVLIIQPGRRTKNGLYLNRIVFNTETNYVTGVWFNQPYIKNNFKVGEKVLLYGRVSKKSGEIQIIDPQYEKEWKNENLGIMPVYATNKYISQKILRKVISQAITNIDSEFNECLPENIRKIYSIPDIKTTLMNIHFPSNFEIIDACRSRIKFEELLILQLALFIAKNHYQKNLSSQSIPICTSMKNFKESLTFSLTGAQSRTIKEILTDMQGKRPMNRLVQGDVGSGKTIVAAVAMFNCAMNGFQCAMMAPTEILAEQHYLSLSKLFEKWNIKVELITGSLSKKQKEEVLKMLSSGEVDIVVGTHALIQEGVEFKNLGMVVTDEQHRFGVRQRMELVNKGKNPHVLVMTATPIPRTLALFLYGDMDISIIDELPPGRQKVETLYFKSSSRDKVYSSLRREIDRGRQAYVVCPLVEESDKLDAESAVETEKILKENYFKDYEVGLLHGKMSPKEKEDIMKSFKDGKIKILVSTTVIEVGINVPNATVMVIENADRFGLAQLHQLRGRVGRGKYKSYCILISDVKTMEASERMRIMKSTSDGFVIAEKDLELRGTGEFFGTRQHGLPELKMADIIKDIVIVKQTRDIAKEILEKGYIMQPEYSFLKKKIEIFLNEKFDNMALN